MGSLSAHDTSVSVPKPAGGFNLVFSQNMVSEGRLDERQLDEKEEKEGVWTRRHRRCTSGDDDLRFRGRCREIRVWPRHKAAPNTPPPGGHAVPPHRSSPDVLLRLALPQAHSGPATPATDRPPQPAPGSPPRVVHSRAIALKGVPKHDSGEIRFIPPCLEAFVLNPEFRALVLA
jgi:hypothetical protein